MDKLTRQAALAAAEAMRREAAREAGGEADLLRRQGHTEAATAHENAARRVMAISADAVLASVGQPASGDELAAFEQAAGDARFSTSRINGAYLHPITARVRSVWNAAVLWAGREVAPAGIEGLTRYGYVSRAEHMHFGEVKDGLYVKFADVERLLGAHAGVVTGHKKRIEKLRAALQSISTTRFGWDGDCGVTTIADDALYDDEQAAGAAPAAQAPVPTDREKLTRAALDAAEKWSQQEHLHARDIGRGGPGSLKKVERAERDARAAIQALAAAPVQNAEEVPSQWISVEDRLPEPEQEVAVFGVNRFNGENFTGTAIYRNLEFHVVGDIECTWCNSHWMPLPQPPEDAQ